MFKKYKLITVIGCVLIVLFFCVGSVYIWELKQEQRDLQPIPKELGINSWRDFHNYVNKTFVEGMSREEMIEELEKFEDYRITPLHNSGSTGTYCQTVGFPIGQPVNFDRWDYLACFSESDDILMVWTVYD